MSKQERTGRQELIDIYSNLLPPLKKKVLDVAKIVEDTQEILIEEYKSKEIRRCKRNKKI